MNGKNNDESTNSFRSGLLIYAFMGIFIGIFLLPPFSLFLKMNIIMGMLIFMIMTTMISDFSSVLLDIDDKNILLPRPVDAKTLNTAKLIHIVVYLFSITLAITAGALAIGFFRYGFLFFLVLLFEIILICGFVILFTSLFYYVILTVFSGEKLKDIINYFQIALTISMTVMYQLIGRIFNFSDLNISITPNWWHLLLPSAWFAAPFSIFIEHDYNSHYVVLSLVGIIVPIIAITLYVMVVAPRFERNLQKLNSGSAQRKTKGKASLRRRVSNIICHNPIEKVFFMFTLQMLDNERKLKLRIFPNMAFSVAFPFIFLLNLVGGRVSFSDIFAQISQGRYYLYLYFSVALLAAMFPLISLSQNYKGAWIYKALPVENPAVVFKGAFKGFLYKYIVPTFLFMSFLFIGIYGVKIVPDLALIFLNMLILMLAIFHFSKKELPFYKEFQYAQNGSSTGMIFLMFALCGVAAAVHYFALVLFPFGLALNIGISLIIVIILLHYSFKISWKDIEKGTQ
ncbi:MAG: hypothetical protein EOM28_08560 [Clostridia bacterium]|nr:hypothetical protein [Clostridia bacterium]